MANNKIDTFDLKSGDKLVCKRTLYTPAGTYQKGDIFELIEPTGQDPWNVRAWMNPKYLGPHNWLVKTKYHAPPSPTAVWSLLYYYLEKGSLEKL
jgi:hypothetical protein